jgi:hypothetical protein
LLKSTMEHVVPMRTSRVCPALIHRLGVLLWESLGSCPRCVRSAFRAALVAWVLTGLRTLLWLGHLLVHAIKVSAAARRRQEGISNPSVVSRRSMMPIFARTLATAALATSIPTLSFAECDQSAAGRCQAATANCRANCDRASHREEANRACHQECYSNYVACRADARCS